MVSGYPFTTPFTLHASMLCANSRILDVYVYAHLCNTPRMFVVFTSRLVTFCVRKKTPKLVTSKHALKKKIKIKIRGKDIWRRRENTERESVLLVSLLFGFVLLRAW